MRSPGMERQMWQNSKVDDLILNVYEIDVDIDIDFVRSISSRRPSNFAAFGAPYPGGSS